MKLSILTAVAALAAFALSSPASAMGRGRVEGPKKTVKAVLAGIAKGEIDAISPYLTGNAYETIVKGRMAETIASHLDATDIDSIRKELVGSRDGVGGEALLRTYRVEVRLAIDGEGAAQIDSVVDCRVETQLMRTCHVEGGAWNPSETYNGYPRGTREVCRMVPVESEACRVSEIGLAN